MKSIEQDIFDSCQVSIDEELELINQYIEENAPLTKAENEEIQKRCQMLHDMNEGRAILMGIDIKK